nr:nodule-specific cysteine-rich peptide L40 [Lens culinaris]
MQKKLNMSQIPNLFFALITFLYVFLDETKYSSKKLFCENSSDCPRSSCYPFSSPICITDICRCI